MTVHGLTATLDVLKDLVGALGAVLAAIPWFADYRRRRLIERLERVRGSDERTSALVEHTRSQLRRWHEGPSTRDLVLQSGGLALIGLSFAIGLGRALFAA